MSRPLFITRAQDRLAGLTLRTVLALAVVAVAFYLASN